jgi:hypothetical protein
VSTLEKGKPFDFPLQTDDYFTTLAISRALAVRPIFHENGAFGVGVLTDRTL